MKYYKHIKTILIFIPVIILAVLVYKDICPLGVLEVEYDLCRESPFFSKLSPGGRVLEIEKKKGYCEQKMVIDPVYFDVRLPQSFRKAEMEIWYQKSNAETPLKIGPRLNPDAWAWDLQDVIFYAPMADWSIGKANFDLTKTKMDNNRIRFLISSTGLDESDKNIKFRYIKIRFEKEPLSWSNLLSRIRSLIKSVIRNQ